MANYQQDNNRRQSAIQNLLNMFHLSNTQTVHLDAEEDLNGDLDEPPDEQPSSLRVNSAVAQEQQLLQTAYTRSPLPAMDRKESLLTRALMTNPNSEVPSPLASPLPGALSRASTFSNASMPSTAELTSDADDNSPARSASSSPPLPAAHYHQLHASAQQHLPPTKISFATSNDQQGPAAADAHESKIEANLGRKRCITFACTGKPAAKESPQVKDEKMESTQPLKRKCMLTFACPARPTQSSDQNLEPPSARRESGGSSAEDSSALAKERQKVEGQAKSEPQKSTTTDSTQTDPPNSPASPWHPGKRQSEASPFHEFATSNEHEDAWVHEPIDSQRKLTLSDCMRMENAIRKIGQEAEEEAEEEEKDQEELDDQNEDGDNEDDFAPSDDGNESDNEAGFAESDDDSGAESDDQFWVPVNTTAATSVDHLSPVRPVGLRRQSGSSIDSMSGHELRRKKTTDSIDIKYLKHRRPCKNYHLRPDTPDLPDSTDFVCGTLDEDRPLEAAYISCLEQKKREKHIPIPQDIDPSFPTTDPEDMDEEDDEDLDVPEDHLWLKDQLEGFEDESNRGHPSRHPRKKATLRSPRRPHSPPPKHGVRRSPPPPRLTVRRASPTPKGRLFGHSPKRLHSPPPPFKLRSPPGTRRQSPADMSPIGYPPQGLVINRLAQRPHMTGTSSLPRTPNPFFHNYHARTQQNDRVAFGDATPGRELHVRGPVDIVIGLEKKRQKRKEKFWRQHCRRNAKEQAERKTIPGKGAERMRELGLECAERTRGYGLGQQPPLVISL
jgi:Protein of unknown function (DUF2457)